MAVEPIRDTVKIEAMKRVLKGNSIRDYLLFVLGINTGLRISDLLQLRVGDIMDGGKPRRYISISEKKTNKTKQFQINKAIKDALAEYMAEYPDATLEQYLFISREGQNKPITRVRAWGILNDAAKLVGVESKVGTHTLRKTFGYHAYKQGIDVTLLQKIFNHSAPSITLRYIGITQDDIDNVYLNLNL